MEGFEFDLFYEKGCLMRVYQIFRDELDKILIKLNEA